MKGYISFIVAAMLALLGVVLVGIHQFVEHEIQIEKRARQTAGESLRLRSISADALSDTLSLSASPTRELNLNQSQLFLGKSVGDRNSGALETWWLLNLPQADDRSRRSTVFRPLWGVLADRLPKETECDEQQDRGRSGMISPLVSQFDCIINRELSLSSSFTGANLRLPFGAKLSNPLSDQTLIVVAGEINLRKLTTQLTRKSRLAIIAAGDIAIEQLTVDRPEYFELLLYSATGRVRLDEQRDAPYIRVIDIENRNNSHRLQTESFGLSEPVWAVEKLIGTSER